MSDDREPVLTQRMIAHLNGGSEYSRLCYEIEADGRPTGIRRNRTTDGGPRYKVTDDVIFVGDESFDVMATGGVGLKAWILAHLPPRPEVGE